MKTAPAFLIIVSIFAFHCNIVKGHNHVRKSNATTDHEIYLAAAERYRAAEKFSKNVVNAVFKKLLPYALEFSEKINVSRECMKNSLHLINGIKNIKMWAMQFLDATGKIPDGMMYGSITAIGHYEQCLDIEVKSTRKKDTGEKLYQGQYCMIEVRANFNVKKPIPQKMHDIPEEIKEISKSDSVLSLVAKNFNFLDHGGFIIGACLPTGCTKEDINGVVRLVSQVIPMIKASTLRCEKKEENVFTPTIILVFIFYALICFLVLTGSIVDLYCSYTTAVKSKVTKALLAFSLVTNLKTFCSPKEAPDSITCLNGMKFLGLTWVILGHTFVGALTPVTHGYLRGFQNTKDFAFQAVENSMFAVDTFFIIGSFLLSYLTTKHVIKQKKKFSVLMYIVHRLWRLYPAYIVLLSTVVIIPLLGSGPFWNELTSFHLDHCFKNWWTNLLFISNIYQPTEMCFIHSWYITVDVQLYILSLLCIIPLMRWPKLGLSLIILGIIGHVLFCGIITYVNEWPPVVLYSLMNVDETMNFLAHNYFVSFSHLGPYGIGLLLGYIYALNPDFKMSRSTQVLGWCIAFICSFSVLYGSRGWYVRTMPQSLAIVYASLSKIGWSVGPAWIIFCCATGHGGIINWILSWRVFKHLGRLTFSAFLIHIVPVIVLQSGLKTRIQPDLYLFVWFFIGSLCATFLLGFILHLFVEVPFANLERVFLLEARKEPESSEKENNFVNDESKEGKKCDIIILTPPDKDCSAKL